MKIVKNIFNIIILVIMLMFTSCGANKTSKNPNELKSTTISTADNFKSFMLPNGNILSINENRFNDDVYGTGQLDNRWELDEIDSILDSIRGTWEINQYIGFVDSSIYIPDLFDKHDNLSQDIKDELNEKYALEVQKAKENIPQLSFSVKEIKKYDETIGTSNNYIYSNSYASPISIILSLERIKDNYPVFNDRTTISKDFYVDYPVIYIQFFIKDIDVEKEDSYVPATIIMSSDNKLSILLNGAFYSLNMINSKSPS